MDFEDVFYYIAVIAGALIAAGVYYGYLYKNKTERKLILKIAFLFSAALILALIISVLTAFLIFPDIMRDLQEGWFNVGFQYYITAVCFIVFSRGFLHFAKVDKQYAEAAIIPVVVFSAVARVGCLVAGCCEGARWAEFIFALAALAALIFFVKKYRTAVYLAAYSAFRFINEFFRVNEGMSTVAGLTIFQILALIVLFYITAAAVLAVLERRQKPKKR